MSSIRHVVCGISGGVDSAVAAMLLKRQGFRVTGLFMQNWDLRDEAGGTCTWEQDAEDAQYVCDRLNIPLKHVSFVKQYWTDVFSQLVSEYQAGLTPNPDILCNKHIKFGPFVNHAVKVLGADAIATGHYARSSAGTFLQHADPNKGVRLLCSVDQNKDQTLFLSQIPQSGLRRTMFPVGDLLKTEVKRLAREAGLVRIADKRESFGICFIGKRHFQHFIQEYLDHQPGDFVDVDTGKVVGKHKGVHLWTLGQRVHLGGLSKAYFAAARCPHTQQILVARGTDHPALYHLHVHTEPPCWIHRPPDGLHPGGAGVRISMRSQHVHPLCGCVVSQSHSGELTAVLDLPHRSVAPGQFLVLYDGDECLGSAKITSSVSLYELNVREPVQSAYI